MGGVGIVSRLKVAAGDDKAFEGVMRDLVSALEAEEFPGGGLTAYAVYREPNEPGRWYVYGHFTDEGFATHGAGPLVQKAGAALTGMLIEPYEQTRLDPVIIHGCGEAVPKTPGRPAGADPATDVGVVYGFRVKPEDDQTVEGIMREIFDIMAIEEYPTGDVVTYTLYRDPAEKGRWVMFEHFTAKGSADHATGKLIYEPGMRQLNLTTEPYTRILLTPVVVRGCGEPALTPA